MNQPKLRNLHDGGVIYQLFLRMFTPEGTLQRAKELLPGIAGLGVSAVCLCPVAEADGDTRRDFWSDRQKRSGMNNPRNPYRIRDYFKIDPEYGSDGDLRAFIAEAHRVGLRVLLDLVYFHCGPGAAVLDLIDDCVERDENGCALPGIWHFPKLNFHSAKLREYLISNMEYFIREFDADGYRCDVASQIPVDFWEEARRRIDTLKPDIFMLSEGEGEPEEVKSAFECAYGFSFLHKLCAVLTGRAQPGEIRQVIDLQRERLGAGRVLRGFDNHDIAHDTPEIHDVRDERTAAALALCYALDGYPFLYNGQEACDHNRHSLFSPPGRGYGVDWSRGFTAAGAERRTLLVSLAAMRRENPELFAGSLRWLAGEEGEKVLSFVRAEKILAVISLDENPARIIFHSTLPRGTELSQNGATLHRRSDGSSELTLKPFGWFIRRFEGKI